MNKPSKLDLGYRNQNYNPSSYLYSFQRASNSDYNRLNKKSKSNTAHHFHRCHDESTPLQQSKNHRNNKCQVIQDSMHAYKKLNYSSIEQKDNQNSNYCSKDMSMPSFGENLLNHSYNHMRNDPINELNTNKDVKTFHRYNQRNTQPKQQSTFGHNKQLRLSTEPNIEVQEPVHLNLYHRKKCQQYNREPNNSYTKESNNSKYQQQQMRKLNDQKISNIEKINNKIKTILQTLSEEQKKINSSQQFKIVNSKKKIHGYSTRIRTEGDVYDDYHQSTVHYRDEELRNVNQYKPVYLNNSYQAPYPTQPLKSKIDNYQIHEDTQNTVYSRLQSIKKKYKYDNSYRDQVILKDNNYSLSKSRNPLGEINLNNFEKKKNTDYLNHMKRNSFDNMQMCNFESFSGNQNERKQYSKIKTSSSIIKKYGIEDSDITQSQFNQTKDYAQNTHQDEQNARNTQINRDYEKNHENISTPSQKLIKESYSASKSFTRSRMGENNQKNYDEEIEKIQQKIQKFQNIKKQMGIYIPSPSKVNIREMIKMSHSRTKSSNNQQKMYNRQKIGKNSEQKINIENTGALTKGTGRFLSQFSGQPSQTRGSNISAKASLYEEVKRKASEEKCLHQIAIPKPFKLQSKRNASKLSSINGSNIIESQFISEQRFQDSNTKQSAQRKSKIFHKQYEQNQAQEIENLLGKELIKKLCKQIQLDNALRDLKKWFTKKNSPYKWVQLKKNLQLALSNMDNDIKQYDLLRKKLQNIQLHNSEHFLKCAFVLSQEQDNPFYTHRDEDGASYEKLIKSYFQAQSFWTNNISQQYQLLRLTHLNSEIDIDRKGYITMEDLVRYVNIESDQYYRNRDISLVYRRFGNKRQRSYSNIQSNPEKNQIVMSDILNQLCYDFSQQ